MSSSERKRKRASATDSPLHGLTLAISTMDVKGQQHANRDVSYKAIQALVRKLGGNPTGQVHRRVSALLCTATSLRNATQRVRKAVKLNIPLVDVAWLYACQEGRVDWTTHVLDKDIVRKDSKEEGLNPDYEEVPEHGWTEEVDVGCCCVCHENLDHDCPWCEHCSVNRSKKQKAEEDKCSLDRATSEKFEALKLGGKGATEHHEVLSSCSPKVDGKASGLKPARNLKKETKKKKRKANEN